MTPVKIASRGAVRELTLNDPATLNALTVPMLEALHAAILAAGDDPSVRAVILTGEGRGFCSGANLSGDVGRPGADVKTVLDRHYAPTILAMRNLEKPIVCAVNGVAAGAGLSLALACDLRVAGQSARFIQIFARIGLMPDAGSTWFLPRLVGPERARLMAMTGDAIDAATAAAWNLALEVAPDEALMERARGLADRLAAGPTRAIGAIRRALDAAESNTLAEQLALEANMQQVLAGTRDFEEGVAAFAQKRKAAFEGR